MSIIFSPDTYPNGVNTHRVSDHGVIAISRALTTSVVLYCTPSTWSDPNQTAQVVPISCAKSILQLSLSRRSTGKSPISNLWTVNPDRMTPTANLLLPAPPFVPISDVRRLQLPPRVRHQPRPCWKGVEWGSIQTRMVSSFVGMSEPCYPWNRLLWASCSWGFFDVRNQIQIFSHSRAGTLILSFFGV
jgi:hypothetical protein